MTPEQTNTTGQAPLSSVDDAQANRDIAALAYVWILSVVIYFSRKNSPFVRFHSKQGIVLFLLSILVWFIPFVGRILELVVLAFCALGFLSAAQGQWKELPLVGPLARGDKAGMRASWRTVTDAIVRMWHELMSLFHRSHAATPGPVAPKPGTPVPSAAPSQPSPPPTPHV